MHLKQQYLGVTGSFCILLGGCAAHASLNAGYGNTSGRQSTGSAPAVRASNEPGLASSPSTPVGSQQGLQQASPPAEPSSVSAPPAAQAAAQDHDRGHGNDADHHDEGNPGRARHEAQAAKQAGQDHDRGHGNDADHVDEDNPGKSKKKK